MGIKMTRLFFGTFCLLLCINAKAQQDTSTPIRDNIGDMNESGIRKGEFPGAIKIPSSGVSLAIGGFIKAVALYDSKFNEKNEVIFPGTFSAANIDKGQTYLGARSSRLFFDGRITLGTLNLRGYYEMDFRGSNGFTLRHAYLQLTTGKNQKILMGQYWSLAMDLQTIPEGLVEPTVSGGGFARHGQLRFTTPLGRHISFAVSVEEPNNSDIKGPSIRHINKFPDLIGSFSFDPLMNFHLSLTGMYRPVSYADELLDERFTGNAYLLGLGLAWKPGTSHRIQLGGIYGAGASNYIMGADAMAGYVDNNLLDLQQQYGGYFSYRHTWNDKFRTNIALGRFMGNEIENTAAPNIKSSTYGFINTFFKLNRFTNIGIEWIYTKKENHKGGNFLNNRFQFGIQVF